VAGLADHDQYCGDALCCPDTRYIVSRRPGDGEPWLSVSNVNAAQLLRALGLLPELGADCVFHQRGPVPRGPGDDVFELVGECEAQDLLGRIELALALSPLDEGTPWHPITPGSNVTDCG
jgi:hypothetical protein